MQQPLQPGKILRWVNASERTPSDPGSYHTNLGLTEWGNSGIKGDDEYYWLNRHGGHVTEWFEETEDLSAPASPVEEALSIKYNMPQTENPQASYWFEKARQNLVDRNDFKAQLSRANDKIKELTESKPSPIIEIGEKEPLEMNLQFQNHGDSMTIQCPDEDGQFTIMVKSKGARHWQVYCFDNTDAGEITSFLSRHIANSELEGSVTEIIEQKGDEFAEAALKDFKVWCDKEEDQFPVGSAEQFGFRIGAVAAYKYRQTEIDLLTDMAAKLNKGWIDSVEENKKLSAPHPAPAPIVGQREEPSPQLEVNDLPGDVQEDIYRSGQESAYYGGYDLNTFIHAGGWMWRVCNPSKAAPAEQALPEEVDKDWESRKIDRLAEVISMSEDHIRELQEELANANIRIKELQDWHDSHL